MSEQDENEAELRQLVRNLLKMGGKTVHDQEGSCSFCSSLLKHYPDCDWYLLRKFMHMAVNDET